MIKSSTGGRKSAELGKLFVNSGPISGETHRGSRSDGADDEIRTRDLRFTKPLLYQLSYVGVKKGGGNMPSALTRATRMIRR